MKKAHKKVVPPVVKNKIKEMKEKVLKLMKEKEELEKEVYGYVDIIERCRGKLAHPLYSLNRPESLQRKLDKCEKNLEELNIETTQNKYLKYKIQQIKEEIAKPSPLELFDYKSLARDEKLVDDYTFLMNYYTNPPDYPSKAWVQETAKKLVLDEPPSFSDAYYEILLKLHSFRNNFHELNIDEKRLSIADAKEAQKLMNNIESTYADSRIFKYRDNKVRRSLYKKQCITDFNTLRLSVQRIFY